MSLASPDASITVTGVIIVVSLTLIFVKTIKMIVKSQEKHDQVYTEPEEAADGEDS